jgi:hypothetical protein
MNQSINQSINQSSTLFMWPTDLTLSLTWLLYLTSSVQSAKPPLTMISKRLRVYSVGRVWSVPFLTDSGCSEA